MAEELNLELLVDELRLLPSETEWVEFKRNNDGAETIAQDISALANSATRFDAPHAYMVWGIDDETHDVLGTDFRYRKARRGGEELENWLHHMLSPNASFRFFELKYQGCDLVVLQIEPARGHTVDFESVAYIRIGSYTKKLKAYPAVESEVWRRITHASFELDAALEGLSSEDVLGTIDYPKYFALLKAPMPQTHAEIIRCLVEDAIVARREDGLYTITNLGAILLANDLAKFPTVSRKAIRVIQYQGNTKTSMVRERTSSKGYAVDYEATIEFIMALTPSDEPIVSGLRGQVTQYPEITIRENLANMLIHQDLSISGSGPLVEIFRDRIDFTNPGVSLVETLRLVDNPPRSRNEKLASLMRRFGICEEAGSGWDKIIGACEEYAMPAPPRGELREQRWEHVRKPVPLHFLRDDGCGRASDGLLLACLHVLHGAKSHVELLATQPFRGRCAQRLDGFSPHSRCSRSPAHKTGRSRHGPPIHALCPVLGLMRVLTFSKFHLRSFFKMMENKTAGHGFSTLSI